MKQYDDAIKVYEIGRKYYNDTNNCAVVAVAIVCRVAYGKAFNTLKRLGRVTGRGTPITLTVPALNQLGFQSEHIEFNKCTVSTITRQLDKNSMYLVRVRGHILAVRNGDVIDWSKGRRHRVLQVLKVTKLGE